MNLLTLAARGLGFYRRTHLGVVAGCAVSAAVLSGALFVGDSARGSLERLAQARLGRFEVALDSGNRFFRADLADRLKTDAAPVLRLQGMAIRERLQVNRVEVLGVDGRFLKAALKPGTVAINGKLAAALGARAGDEVSLRVFKPGLLSRDAPLASRKERDTRRALFTVAAVLSDAELGRFSLKSDQAAPCNAFVDLKGLQETMELEGRANLLVAEEAGSIRDAWTLEDAGLSIRPGKVVQLQSERIYLDPGVAARALELRPDSAGVLSYLVDSISSERGSTPYSFMTAISPSDGLGPVPTGMKDDEILVNRWLADQLSVKEGDTVRVAWSELGAGSAFVPRQASFRVRGILEMEPLAAEKDLVPEFPGLTDVDACKDWDIGLPLEEAKLKDAANEAYWNRYRHTPKAFVTLAAGRAMWANRYGDLMAVRYRADVGEDLRRAIDPAEAGLVFRPVGEEARRAARESMDLGGLFLGMSLFIIAASLLLTAMFFVFTVEQRAAEMGLLRAVGLSPARVRGLFLLEGAVLAVLGSLAGIPLGWAFAKALVWGLGAAWSGAVAAAPIEFHARAGTAILGASIAAAVSLIIMAVALRRQAKRAVGELMAEGGEEGRPVRGRPLVFGAGLLGAAAVAGWTVASGAAQPAGGFFAAGALLLVGGLAGVKTALARLSKRASGRLSSGELGLRNAARRPGRSLATAGMLACGSFVVFSVAAMKEDLEVRASDRRSGTGGFELLAESSVPVVRDLGREMEGVSILALRLREGDDASCLNLNQSPAPPLVGVDPAKMAELGAFAGPEVWKLLEGDSADGAVAALVGDSATAMWKLKKKVDAASGDVLDYRDERGQSFKVRLVGALPPRLTVLQGRLLVAERHFTRLFPSEGGHRLFLVDAPAGSEERVRGHLAQKFEASGLDAVRAVDRLKEFYVVESSYLGMFLVLGGLGLLLGSAGMGVLVLRNVMERRSELALLQAVGCSKDEAARVVMAEHRFLLAAGLVTGLAASALALLPSFSRPEMQAPYGLLVGFLFGTAALSLLWIRLATSLALRAPLLPALRQE